ncbi:hypothetical protein HRbin16_02224 [bacterium HR16]|nr:hypothetical protein HRbin16_02224 [bacterium HR16]
MGDDAEAVARVIVSNTGPLLHLGQVEAQYLLHLLGNVYVPHEVLEELVRLSPQRGWEDLTVVDIQPLFAKQAQQWIDAGYLDRGEAAAIALAKQIECEWFFTDDTRARVFARALGLEVHGTLGVVIACASLNLITVVHARQLVSRLYHESSLWLSARVFEEAMRSLDRLAQDTSQ